MRFVTYEHDGHVSCGAVDEFDRIHPLPAGTRLIDLIAADADAGADALRAAGAEALAAGCRRSSRRRSATSSPSKNT